jgi:hypothetical protein
MPTFIRLTDYKSSDTKEAAFFDPANRYQADQNDFVRIPGFPISYWISNHTKEIFLGDKLNKFASGKTGIVTGDSERFYKNWYEVEYSQIGFTYSNISQTLDCKYKWFPVNNGGDNRKWYGNLNELINFYNNAEKIHLQAGCMFRNEEFYFRESISWNNASYSKFAVRCTPIGFIFSGSSPSMFPTKPEDRNYILSFLNTHVAYMLKNIINSGHRVETGHLAKLPYLMPHTELIKQQISFLAQQCIDISKQEWDSREISWDFTRNELLKHKPDNTLENALNAYSTYWSDRFNMLHANEEELNRLFIDIYGLQDELTSDVELKDITILKTESNIINGKLEFQKDEIIEQFISYAVGCMFGRYSLDREGLILANQGDTLQDYLERIGTVPTFEVDDDDIIPIVDEADYFSDDITDRFTEFVKTTFGPEKLQQNIAYIENALGKKIRAYFTKDFYIDHTKRYSKRPIYWLFSSPKGSFQMLVYMHRYTPDTLNHILNDYLRPFRIRLDSMRNESMRLTERVDSSAKEKADADKKIDKIDKTLHDINEYEKVLAHYAAQRIEIDLDDGVKVNYCKFKELLYEFDKKFCK